ncbi:MAG: transposase [Ignavibacteriales bacterium]|nr:transposase [Ignavibacteriales bacterium]
MNPQNRWVQLVELIPLDELTKIYAKGMSDFGRPGINGRIVIGSIIIKTLLSLSDEETLDQIRENLYMQYFLGYPGYVDDYPFEASLFVYIRDRMGKKAEASRNVDTIKLETNGEKK